ncbi:hypothetical protein ABEF95_009688 [Exophiala dermatitidis]
MDSPHHSRKPSSRAGLPRRSTKGPLDPVDDPLTAPPAVAQSLASPRNSPSLQYPQQDIVGAGEQPTPQPQPAQADPTTTREEPVEEARDLSFLLDASIYHSLSQLEVPGPFRRPFLPAPSDEAQLVQALEQLDRLLSQCDFLRAAQLAGSILTSGTIHPSDAKTIFRLLAVRYSCLELSGNLLLAAQEAKALEDLSSAFYYDDAGPDRETVETGEMPRNVAQHIMPFSLRLQALRLQSIGFSDPRRGVTTLYDTALECREHLAHPTTSPAQRAIWTERLQEVSIRVVNALIEMGDLDCAARTLKAIRSMNPERMAVWTARMVLLQAKIGDCAEANALIASAKLKHQERLALESLVAVAEGRYDVASQALDKCELEADSGLKGLLKQNLAVACLYQGEVQKARRILEELVEQGHSFQSLTINLATIYDLSSERSRDLKLEMAAQIARQQTPSGQLCSFVNADFKL